MLEELGHIGPLSTFVALAFGFLAGLVKGMTGFALPMILVSGLGSFLAPELALAGMIIPALITNVWQALRQGAKAALASVRVHWRYLGLMLLWLTIASQFVLAIPAGLLFLILGLTVTFFTSLQLAGWQPKIAPDNRLKAELGIGSLAGVLGGLTGTWGPPTVMYLTALSVPKRDHVRIQGVVYGSGAVMLTLAHLRSGVLSGPGLSLSLAILPVALLGMAAGMAIQDRLDQKRFQQVVLVVLAVAGLNLIRRGLMP
ncbi:MAG: sulfite exporter TauE/SafE family protein [Silicimonas sp.]|nr:sulfite exporter TauE/SafE family protein [Silicimonas sp.]